MGLDVALSHCKDVKKFVEEEEIESKESDRLYKEIVGSAPDGKNRDLLYKEFEAQLKQWKKANRTVKEKRVSEQKSTKHPNHLFNLAYLRSSYNEQGTNSVLQRTIGTDLYDIFGQDGKSPDHYFAPDWSASLERAKKALEDYRKYQQENPRFDLMRVSARIRKDSPQDLREATAAFNKEFAKAKSYGGFGECYSGADGFFAPKGLKILGIIPGKAYGSDYMYVAYELEPLKPGETDWYEAALEVTVEMIEWVLSQPHPNEYFFHWSA